MGGGSTRIPDAPGAMTGKKLTDRLAVTTNMIFQGAVYRKSMCSQIEMDDIVEVINKINI